MTDAGEKLRERVRRQIEFRAEVPMSTMRDVEVIVRAELERAALEAEHVAVGWDYSDVPELLVDEIAAAIRKLKE